MHTDRLRILEHSLITHHAVGEGARGGAVAPADFFACKVPAEIDEILEGLSKLPAGQATVGLTPIKAWLELLKEPLLT